MPQYREVLAIGRIKRILDSLGAHQRLLVLEYVSQAECAAQEAARPPLMETPGVVATPRGNGALSSSPQPHIFD